MSDLDDWAAQGDWRRRSKAQSPLGPYADRRISRLWRRIKRAGHASRLNPKQRHKLRIRIKQLRYGLDFTETLHRDEPGQREKFGRGVKRVQNRLGELNDLVVGHRLAAKLGWSDEVLGYKTERKLVRKADRALKRLGKIEPYWTR